MQCIIEIIAIGNELLIGKIGNTNAQWLARYITGLGGNVRRISVVGNEFLLNYLWVFCDELEIPRGILGVTQKKVRLA